MNTRHEKAPSARGQQLLGVLRQAVGKVLEKKRRLGQYAVVWKDGKPELAGEDERGLPYDPHQ